jgi:ABC-2 type transport system ATP-binding protein
MVPNEIMGYFGKLRGMKNHEIEENSSRLLKLVGLEDWKKKKIGTFSRGMKQRLALAQALIHDPQILLLDEPTIGLDPRGMAEVREIFRSLKKEGKTIFMSSHLIKEVQEICDSVALIDKGRLILSNTIENLSAKSDSVDIEMKLVKPPPPEQIALLKNMIGIESVLQVNPTTLKISYKGSFDDVVLLLKRIVNQDLMIYSFRTTQGDLEGLYMKMIRESVR